MRWMSTQWWSVCPDLASVQDETTVTLRWPTDRDGPPVPWGGAGAAHPPRRATRARMQGMSRRARTLGYGRWRYFASGLLLAADRTGMDPRGSRPRPRATLPGTLRCQAHRHEPALL